MKVIKHFVLWNSDTKVLNYLWDYTGISDETHQATANEAFCFRQAKMIFKSV